MNTCLVPSTATQPGVGLDQSSKSIDPGPILLRLGVALICGGASIALGYLYASILVVSFDAFIIKLSHGFPVWAATLVSSSASAYGITVVAVTLLALFIVLRLQLFYLLAVIAIQLGSAYSASTMKEFFDRARPIGERFALEATAAYPSGHAASAVAFYGGIIWLTARSVRSQRWRQLICIGIIMWILMIGWSRLALGVHYASDVVGGYLLGLAWALAGTGLFDAIIYRTGTRSSVGASAKERLTCTREA